MPCHTAPQGETTVWLQGRRNEGKVWPRALIVFSMGKARHGWGYGLGLASLHNSSGLQGLGAVPGCVEAGPGLI